MILALVDHDRDRLDPLSLQVLTLGRRLANEDDDRLEAVLVGEEGGRPLADGLAAYGVSTVHLVQHAGLDDYAPEAWAESMVQLLSAVRPQVVIAAGSERARREAAQTLHDVRHAMGLDYFGL